MLKLFALFLGLGAVALADPEADARAAVQALREQSGYAWETTARTQETRRSSPEGAAKPVSSPRAAGAAVRGKSEAVGFTEVTLLPSKATLDVSVTAYIQSTIAAVADTPLGWLTRQEIRDAPMTQRDKAVTIEGKHLRLYRYLSIATRATNVQTPIEELLLLLNDIGRFEETAPGEITGELKPMAAQMLAGDSNVRRSLDLKARVIFRVSDGVVREFETRFEAPQAETKSRAAGTSITYWTTTLSSIGSTRVTPPLAAAEKLNRL